MSGLHVACKVENNVPFAEPKEAAKGRVISWMDVITTVEGEYPNVRARYLPRPCMQCDNPPCIKVCPVQATTRTPKDWWRRSIRAASAAATAPTPARTR